MANREQADAAVTSYEAEIATWRQMMEERLRSDNGWLTLTGLYWLREGENTLGSEADADVALPASAPASVGVIVLQGGQATLRLNGQETGEPLRDDSDAQGATRIEIGSVSFAVIKRGDQYGVRVRDRENPTRQGFTGRIWHPVDARWRISATFRAHPEPRTLPVMSVAGIETPMENPGAVEFTIDGQALRLEAFAASESELWFVFKDAGAESYHGGRFLYAPVNGSEAILDFNKAYNPPCAFTAYATCPIPPQANSLPIAIAAGEQTPQQADKDA